MNHASTLDACRSSMVKIAFGLKCLQVVVARTKEALHTLATKKALLIGLVANLEQTNDNNNDNKVRTNTWDFPDSKKGLGST